jgi:hypothetical protein
VESLTELNLKPWLPVVGGDLKNILLVISRKWQFFHFFLGISKDVETAVSERIDRCAAKMQDEKDGF